MAYVKYKELTKYFNFNKEIEIKYLPTYVTDYLDEKETVYKAYKTLRDKKIHIIPYKSISSGAILFKVNSAAIFLSFDSGYKMRLNFVKLDPKEKTELRKLYSKIMNSVI